MIGVWHKGEWLKRDLTQPFYGRVERDCPTTGWFITFINEKSIPLIFMCKGIDVFMDFMVYIFILFCSYYVGYMHIYDMRYVWVLACFYLYVNG